MTTLLRGVRPYFRDHPAPTLNLSGLMFGLGCLLVTLVVGGAYNVYPVQLETVFLALFPLLFFFGFLRRGVFHPNAGKPRGTARS